MKKERRKEGRKKNEDLTNYGLKLITETLSIIKVRVHADGLLFIVHYFLLSFILKSTLTEN